MKTFKVSPLLLRFVVLISLLSAGMTACQDDEGTTPSGAQADLLVANNWRTNRVTTVDGQNITVGRLNLATQVLFNLNMQFRSNGTVRALDPNQSNTVVNGGTWTLAPDGKSIDVVVTGFTGNFPIVELNRNKLILRQKAPVDGKDADINLEFIPTL
ncbi:hypothetical protein [Spirosoma lacussanchae]|uniref:hypothetical protein n=2 Tax=Spirosoma lacussanchae TaxID=1884249 RepID=UPI0011091DFD